MSTIEKFFDSQQQEAWRAYACAASQGIWSHWLFGFICLFFGSDKQAAKIADQMLAEEMKRSRG